MSFFKKIMSKIFGGVESGGTTASIPAGPPVSAAGDASSAPSSAAVAPTPQAPVDVAAVLDGMAANNSEKLDWKRSIVDLLKLLDMDSSLASRKELATELKFTGDPSDSATMNIWLHKQVLKKLSENGGKVPAELLD